MPNHVRNVLKFSKLSAKDKEFILNNFTTKVGEDGVYPLDRHFDFDKIIPEPRVESDCPDDCKVNKDSHVEEDAGRSWFDWYKWHLKYWGTKWNCYDGYVKIGTSTITFVFSTAWSTPLLIYEKLSRICSFPFTIRFADEDLGCNCGVIEYDPDGAGELLIQSEHDLPNPTRFARDLWRNY